MHLGLGLNLTRPQAGGAAFSPGDLAGLVFDWRYESASDVVIVGDPDISDLVTRVDGGANATQSVAANRPHKGVGNKIYTGNAQFIDYDVGSEAAHGVLFAGLIQPEFGTRSRPVCALISGGEVPVAVVEMYDTDLDATNRLNLDGDAYSGLTANAYYAFVIAQVGTERYTCLKGAGADGTLTISSGAGYGPVYRYARAGRNESSSPYSRMSGMTLVTGAVSQADVENMRDFYYDWGVDQGFIT